MQDRLNKLLISEKLNPSKFAELVGVQRSSISHMLSGRNKPSFDVIQLILRKFSNINPEWLIMGTGDMYKKPIQTNLFDQTTIFSGKPSTEFNKYAENENKSKSNSKNPVLENKSDQSITESSQTLSPEKALNDKKVDRVVIFYSDKTFAEYRPG